MKRIISALAIAALPLSASAAPLGSFSDFFVFGDSLSDAGNAFLGSAGTIPPNPPYQNGQFTNGNTWATQLGALPSFTGGANYAIGGANAVTDGDLIPDLPAQIMSFVSSAPALGPNSLAAILIGANDIKVATSIPEAIPIFNAVIAEVTSSIVALTASGIGRVALIGLPNLGRFPGVVGTPDQAFATIGTVLFNAALQDTAAAFHSKAVYVDIFSPLEDVFAMPLDFGLDNTTDAFCPTPLTCEAGDADTFFFFDNVHPTEPVHTIIADVFYATVVPLPAGGILLVSAFALAAVSRRRATRRDTA